MRLFLIGWLAAVAAGCATTTTGVQRNGVPPIATTDGKIDRNEVYVCTVQDEQFQCIPYAWFDASRDAQKAKDNHEERL